MRKIFLILFITVGLYQFGNAQAKSKDHKKPHKITCAQYAQNIYNDWRSAGFPPSVAHEQENKAYKDCRQKEINHKLKA